MKRKMNSYGKTWHVWNTGTREHAGDPLPPGDPHLAWSFNRDGEIQPPLLQQRDRALDIDTQRIRESRADLRELAKPQSGVDAPARQVRATDRTDTRRGRRERGAALTACGQQHGQGGFVVERE